jgi:light-regulated signal transduction histidine kinase (bacteriophytochrome)
VGDVAGLRRRLLPADARERRHLALMAAAGLFAVLFAYRLTLADARTGIGILYVVPVALMAFELGPAVGLAAAGLAIGLLGLDDVLSGEPLDAAGYVTRGLAYAFTGVLVGMLARNVRARTAEAERRAAEAERSNAELEQFAYVASHDLSEPLRVITGFMELLKRRYGDRLDDRGHEFVDAALGGAGRMRQLIDALLAYSRIGRGDGNREPVDCEEVVTGTIAGLRAAIDERGARVQIDDLPTVWGDAAQLRQLFQNLISNALKFSREDPSVHVWAERDNGVWRFAVQDNGIGIDPGHAGTVFKMFQRLHLREEYPGTGVGLAICEKVVAQHGGEIWVEPAPEGGSVFKFTLAERTR